MPRQSHNSGGTQSQYHGQLNASLGTSPMYSQSRVSIPNNYYTVPSSSSMPLPQQQQQQGQQEEPEYEPFAPEPLVLPPSQHRASSGAWSPENDHQLVAARMQGLNWGQIKDAYFPGKTANACRKRHERLMERKGADDWDNRKLQRLAREYMSMRKEIWSGLAARTGEKWSVVEQKCMSNGLKNLQSAARAASRRDRLETSSHVTGYDDDSGISGIGLTPVDELDASYSSPELGSSGPSSYSSSGSVGYTFHHAGHHQSHVAAAAAHHSHHHLQPPQPHPGSYAVGAYVSGYAGAGHGYSSSVSSTAAARAPARIWIRRECRRPTWASAQSSTGPAAAAESYSTFVFIPSPLITSLHETLSFVASYNVLGTVSPPFPALFTCPCHVFRL
ncbi:hypothetical protein HIM_05209 [Hirsutella minnesotensis 3608]|uniref:Myb-like domain-containing protein n=1 Tax=Hirsutella minnesotensis 3608 TaxID=1043627 RepID=A0A0F7ZUQ7_9HYPO|nr:hypothetical protein HIM_05209 [Hirsutella minnesotensis 3608]